MSEPPADYRLERSPIILELTQRLGFVLWEAVAMRVRLDVKTRPRQVLQLVQSHKAGDPSPSESIVVHAQSGAQASGQRAPSGLIALAFAVFHDLLNGPGPRSGVTQRYETVHGQAEAAQVNGVPRRLPEQILDTHAEDWSALDDVIAGHIQRGRQSKATEKRPRVPVGAVPAVVDRDDRGVGRKSAIPKPIDGLLERQHRKPRSF